MSKIDEPLYVAISLDIDPDANSAVKGRHDALSSPIEHGEIRVDACKKGLRIILELLEKHDIDATLFYEARTAKMLIEDGMDLPKLSERHEIACHSLKHEDFLGKVSGLPMDEKSSEKTISAAKDILEKIFSNNQVKKNLENLESIFSQIKQMQGIRILRQDKYMEKWL